MFLLYCAQPSGGVPLAPQEADIPANIDGYGEPLLDWLASTVGLAAGASITVAIKYDGEEEEEELKGRARDRTPNWTRIQELGSNDVIIVVPQTPSPPLAPPPVPSSAAPGSSPPPLLPRR